MNPFEMFGQFQEFGEKVQNEINPEWLIKTAFGAAIRFVLSAAKAVGPPPEYAERLKLTEAQAKRLYDLTLDAALTRRTPVVPVALPSPEDAH